MTEIKTKLVKCKICGEIFDASLEKCPVCNAGPEFFEPVESEDSRFRSDTQQRYFILGSGPAAVNAAEAVRKRDSTGNIIILTEEEVLPYNRPMLTKNMFSEPQEDKFAIHDQKWYDDRNIQLIMGKRVKSIDTDAKEITTEDGLTFSYDKCIYTLGAHFFIPPFRGRDAENVTGIRSIGDIEKLASYRGPDKKAGVIGGGVTGLEAAWELRKAGFDTYVFDAAPSLMANKLDPAASGLLTDIFESEGVHIVTSADTEACEDGKIKLKDGREFDADLVIVSCGVRANKAIAEEAGVKTDRAVIVNERMETSASGLYAAGDCAEFEGVNYALWPEASRQGEVAGANAAGDVSVTYKGEAYGMTMDVANTMLYSIGIASGDRPEKTKEFLDKEKKTLKKYFFIGDKLCGATLIGDITDMSEVNEMVAEGRSYSEMFRD